MKDEAYKRSIVTFYRERKRMPSYAEIMRLSGFSSRSSAWKLIARLAREGFLKKDDAGKIAPGPLLAPLLVLGVVEAGFPAPAEQDAGEHISLDEYLIPNRDAAFLLTVKGDSMKNAGIMEGDMVVAERSSNARIGQIVIAEVDGEWTMKYYRSKNGRPYLEAANPAYRPIIPRSELKIAAIVRAVIRKYE
jgi:repressor LexA